MEAVERMTGNSRPTPHRSHTSGVEDAQQIAEGLLVARLLRLLVLSRAASTRTTSHSPGVTSTGIGTSPCPRRSPALWPGWFSSRSSDGCYTRAAEVLRRVRCPLVISRTRAGGLCSHLPVGSRRRAQHNRNAPASSPAPAPASRLHRREVVAQRAGCNSSAMYGAATLRSPSVAQAGSSTCRANQPAGMRQRPRKQRLQRGHGQSRLLARTRLLRTLQGRFGRASV